MNFLELPMKNSKISSCATLIMIQYYKYIEVSSYQVKNHNNLCDILGYNYRKLTYYNEYQ